MSTNRNVIAEKKRKTQDTYKASFVAKKQAKIERSTLHYYFTKQATDVSVAASTTLADKKKTVRREKEANVDTTQATENVCPVCLKRLDGLLIAEKFEAHVNTCLDNSIEKDSASEMQIETRVSLDSPISAPDIEASSGSEGAEKDMNDGEASVDEAERDESDVNFFQTIESSSGRHHNDNGASAWSNLFDTAKYKIRGIWSSKKTDVAPGLTENELSWFGEPKYTLAKTKGKKRSNKVPYYKRLAGTNMVVDAFSFGDIPGCEGYFLSHFHSDHYMGLSNTWSHGPIYCSEITAKLVVSKLGVSPEFVCPLPLDSACNIPTSSTIDEGQQLKVTLIDANHCPGAVIFLFEVGKLRYLHTGDFRASPRMCLHPLLKGRPIDILYLDTTYLNPKYSFPSQRSCIKAACEVARRHNKNEDLGYKSKKRIDEWLSQPAEKNFVADANDRSSEEAKCRRVLIVIGTYSLGKERIFIEIAKTLNSKIFVPERKKLILETFGDPSLMDMLVDDPLQAQVHVIPIWHVIPELLLAYFRSLEPNFTEVIAFKPTGWTFRASADPKLQQQQKSLEAIIQARPADLSATALKPYYDTPSLKIYGVPYSEHSSFRELALFIASLDIRRIVPTVNIHTERSRSKMSDLFEKWNEDKRKLVEKNGGAIQVIDHPCIDYW